MIAIGAPAKKTIKRKNIIFFFLRIHLSASYLYRQPIHKANNWSEVENIQLIHLPNCRHPMQLAKYNFN